MGMFDYVDAPAEPCPAGCGATVGDWQTKDGDRLMTAVHRDALEERLGPDGPVRTYSIHRYYTSCDNCHAWIEYERWPDGTWPPTPRFTRSNR